MEEKKNVSEDVKKNTADQGPQSEEWATEALEEMDDFIESQGIYIRQSLCLKFYRKLFPAILDRMQN